MSWPFLCAAFIVYLALFYREIGALSSATARVPTSCHLSAPFWRLHGWAWWSACLSWSASSRACSGAWCRQWQGPQAWERPRGNASTFAYRAGIGARHRLSDCRRSYPRRPPLVPLVWASSTVHHRAQANTGHRHDRFHCLGDRPFSSFQILRGFPLEQWGTIIYRVNFLIAFSPANIEFGAFGRVADNILSSMPIAQFPTYADAVRNLIPQVSIPAGRSRSVSGRPHLLSGVWEIGGGYTASTS